jgi:hypothetical protein
LAEELESDYLGPERLNLSLSAQKLEGALSKGMWSDLGKGKKETVSPDLEGFSPTSISGLAQ